MTAAHVDGYREFRPGPALAPYVECFWVRRGLAAGGPAQRNRILPDGCIDIIFCLGAPPRRVGLGPVASSYVVGAMRQAVVFDLTGELDILGVRFAPGAAAAFLALTAEEITDRTVALEDFWGQSSARDLEERLRELPRPVERVRLLETALAARLDGGDGPSAIALAASSLIARSAGRVTVGDLCGTLEVGERRLRRIFAGSVGLAPKEACRVARFMRAAELVRQRAGADLGRIAYETGYYDQPHFIREFRRLAGLTPGGYLAERQAVRSVQSTAAPPG